MLYEVRVQPHVDLTADVTVRYGTRPHPQCEEPTWVHERYFKGRIDDNGWFYLFGYDEDARFFRVGEEIDAACYGENTHWSYATNEFVIFGTNLDIEKDCIACGVYYEDEEHNSQFDPEFGRCSLCFVDLKEV